MTPSQKLRSIADSTGLDGIANAIREVADEIEHNNAPAVPQGEQVAKFIEQANSLLALDAANALAPHGIGGFARQLLTEAIRLLATPAAPSQEPVGAFTKALEIRASQGWNLNGNAIPVLYTDTINGDQVMRDDVWLCTTAALKPSQEPVTLTDEALEHLIEDLSEWSRHVVEDTAHQTLEAHIREVLANSAIIAALREKQGGV